MSTTLSDLLLNDRGFAFDPSNGETFQLSTTGLRVVRLLQQGVDHEEILGHLVEEFEVDEKTASRDLADFLRSVGQLGWMTSDA